MGLKPATNPEVEAKPIELTIDGRTVSASDGVSLYDVISSTGKIVPPCAITIPSIPLGPAGCAS